MNARNINGRSRQTEDRTSPDGVTRSPDAPTRLFGTSWFGTSWFGTSWFHSMVFEPDATEQSSFEGTSWFEGQPNDGTSWVRRMGATWFRTAVALLAVVAVLATATSTDVGSASAEPVTSSDVSSSDVSLGVVSTTGVTFSAAGFAGRNDKHAGQRAVGWNARRLHAQGFTGQGIDVAIIDTGVSPVKGLNESGAVWHGPDLSAEAALPQLRNRDTYGHGTHLASIIAGDDGVAPDARIVSVKIAGADGNTSIVHAIAAVEWVIEHGHSHGLNVRVLNLSFGLDDVPSHLNDPLSAAVERAWDAGIVVVAAAGNRGHDANGLDSPAISPYVIAVGGAEGEGYYDGVSSFSSSGNGDRNPDVVDVARSVIAARVGGSSIDRAYPEAVVDGIYTKGSGTSQAAAVVAGSVALLLSKDPSLTPDQVKYVLARTARELDYWSNRIDGDGIVRIYQAARRASRLRWSAPVQNHDRALGIWDWDAAPSWSGGSWSGTSWSGASWSGASWSGASWSGASWSGVSWSGTSWSSDGQGTTILDGVDWRLAEWDGAGWVHTPVEVSYGYKGAPASNVETMDSVAATAAGNRSETMAAPEVIGSDELND